MMVFIIYAAIKKKFEILREVYNVNYLTVFKPNGLKRTEYVMEILEFSSICI